jgi:hypothetical protein
MDPVNYWHHRTSELVAAYSRTAVHDATGDINCDLTSKVKPKGIPRIIHHIWLGGPVPTKLQRLIATWRTAHPSWIHCMWTDTTVAGIDFWNKDAIAAATNYGEVSDILRYEILYSIGGVYVDVDVQCVKSLDPLHDRDALYIGVSKTTIFELNNAVIGAPRGHPLLAAIIQRIREASGQSCAFTGFLKTIATTGPGMLTCVLVDELLAGRMHVNSVNTAEQSTVDYCELEVPSRDILARFKALSLHGYEEQQRSTSTSVLVLSSDCFYPVPNDSPLEPPALLLSDESWKEVVALEAAFPFAAQLGGGVSSYVTLCTYAVHFWAKTWQRPSAQLTPESSTAVVPPLDSSTCL